MARKWLVILALLFESSVRFLYAVDLVEVEQLIFIIYVTFDEFDLADRRFACKWDAQSL